MHLFFGFAFTAIASAAAGYGFRGAIGRDISSVKISGIVADLEAAAEKDVASLKATAISVAADLKSHL